MNTLNSDGRGYIATFRNLDVDYRQLQILLQQYLTEMAYAINIREIAIYDLTETFNGQQFFREDTQQTKRYGYRKVFSLEPIASGATIAIPHDISNATVFTKISGGVVTDVVDYRPVPYSSATLVTDQIEVKVDATNLTIINGATAPAITSGIITLEYLKE